MIFSDNHKPAKQRLVPFESPSDYMITLSCLLSENKTYTHTHTHSQSECCSCVSLQALLQCHSCFNLLTQTRNVRGEREGCIAN